MPWCSMSAGTSTVLLAAASSARLRGRCASWSDHSSPRTMRVAAAAPTRTRLRRTIRVAAAAPPRLPLLSASRPRRRREPPGPEIDRAGASQCTSMTAKGTSCDGVERHSSIMAGSTCDVIRRGDDRLGRFFCGVGVVLSKRADGKETRLEKRQRQRDDAGRRRTSWRLRARSRRTRSRRRGASLRRGSAGASSTPRGGSTSQFRSRPTCRRCTCGVDARLRGVSASSRPRRRRLVSA